MFHSGTNTLLMTKYNDDFFVRVYDVEDARVACTWGGEAKELCVIVYSTIPVTNSGQEKDNSLAKFNLKFRGLLLFFSFVKE